MKKSRTLFGFSAAFVLPWLVNTQVFADVLPAPANVSVTSYNDYAVSLSWTPVDGAQTYDIYENGNQTPLVSYVWGNQYTITGLQGDTDYTFAVAPQDANGAVGGLSASIHVKTKFLPPTDLAFMETNNGNVLSWHGTTSATLGYNVYVNGVKQNETPIQSQNYSFPNGALVPGQLYNFTVSDVNATDESEQSTPLTMTVLGEPTEPSASQVGESNEMDVS